MSDAVLIDAYSRLKSSHKVAKEFKTSRQAVRRRLKELGFLFSLQESHKHRNRMGMKDVKLSQEHRQRLSESAKQRTGDKNPFYGKTHSDNTKKKLSEDAKGRIGKLNPNYRHGEYKRRPKDFKQHKFTALRNFTYNRDKHTCHYCKTKGGHLHAHHILPYWICNEAFLDSENLVTVCSKCHFEKAHKGNWQNFDLDLITIRLKKKYNIHGERLNELASLFNKEEAIVRSTDIQKTVEIDRNVQSLSKKKE